MVAIIAVGLLAFVIPWGEIFQFINVSKDKAFVVDGEVIKTGQYSDRIFQAENLLKARVGGQLSEEQTAQVREEVYQTMVSEILLGDQAEELGIGVTDAELNGLASDMNMSPILYDLFGNPQTGEFNREALNNYLRAVNEPLSTDPNMRASQEELRSTWAYIESLIRFNRLTEKYAALVSGLVLVNDLEAKAYYEGSKNIADIAYVLSEYEDVADESIEVTDAEIQDLYNVRKESFFSKYPSRTVKYLVKDVAPSDADYSETEAQALSVKSELEGNGNVAMLVNQYSTTPYIDAHTAVRSLPVELKNFVNSSSVGDIYGPTRGDRMYTMYKLVSLTNSADSIKVQTLPIQSFDPTQIASIADSLQNVLKGGKSFAALAQEMYPETPQMGEGQWVNEYMLSQVGIADECYKANVGDVLKVQIGGMTSLLRVESKTKPVLKAKVAVVTMPVIVSEKTNNTIDNEINKFLAENKESANFEQAALNQGYNVLDAVLYPNQPTLANIPSTRDVVRWAFNDSKGEIKKFETRDARILAVVTGESKEGYLPVSNSEVNKMLKQEILVNKKAEKLIADLGSKDLSSLANIAESISSRVDTAKFVTFQTNNINGVGYEPVMNVLASQGEVNVISKPLKGNRGVYVMSIADKREDESEFNKDYVKNILRGNYAQMLSYSATYMLMNKMDVEDNRIQFY